MPTLVDAVLELQRAGYTDEQIINYLKQEGFSPKEILDAIKQSKFKEEKKEIGELQPSILEKEMPEELAQAPPPTPTPTPSVPTPTQKMPYAIQTSPEQTPIMPVMPFTQQATAIGMPVEVAQGYNIEAIETLAEEIINEKWEMLKRKIGDIEELRKDFEKKISELNERIKRVELNLDRIHLLILKRQDEQQKEIKTIGKEIDLLEKTLSKILQPLTENIKKLEEISKKLKK